MSATVRRCSQKEMNRSGFSLGTVKFEMPMFLFQGESDVNTPTKLVEEYFSIIQAREKELVLLKDCGHMAVFSKPDVFLSELIARVRPLALDH